MKIQYTQINPEYTIHKRQIHNATEPTTTKKEDQNTYVNIEPIVPISTSKKLILSNDLLTTCIETLAQDIILNEIKILNNNNEEVDHTITDFWNTNNIYELYLALQDRIGYGYGALEVLRNSNGELYGLKQISAETIDIEVVKNNENKSYYCRYNNGTSKERFRLTRYDYTPEDDIYGEVLWLGGGRVSDFYDIPIWIPAFNKISADALLDELNAKKINEGNLISGILTVISPPMTETTINEETGEIQTTTGKEQIQSSLKEQMINAGTGMMVLHLEQLTAELPLNVQYIPITEQNYEYLLQLADDCDNSILRLFKIPKVRLMIDDIKESMNSSKTDAIWEIYTKELKSQQLVYQGIIDQFNKKYFTIPTNTVIELPIFSDKKEIEINTAKDLFNNGLLTLNQTLMIIKEYYPQLNITNDDLNDGRYYNGQLLGLANYTEETSNNKGLQELYAFFNITDENNNNSGSNDESNTNI